MGGVDDREGLLTHTHALLATGDVDRRRRVKAALGTVSAFVLAALVFAVVGINNNKQGRADVAEEIVPGQPRVEVVGAQSRGKAEGVSGKSNAPRLRFGARDVGPAYDWTERQLRWHRTSFHFQPYKNWMNGPLLYKGYYHFFYQYNPNGAVWGDIVWGHAVSRDLVKWTHLPIAMVADSWYDNNGVWTGSATILPNGDIVMLYTGSTNTSMQVQNLAYPANLSDPFLTKWVKYSGNPVLLPPPSIHFKDFRDPTTAWITSEGKWRLTIGSKINRTGIALVYETTDFKNYELLNEILHGVDGTGMWECVDFYPVSMDESNGLDTSINGNRIKHVMKASMDDDRNDYYALGTYDEKKVSWVADVPEIDVGIGLRYDYGRYYASKTFYDYEKNRRILWGWITEADSEDTDIRKGWASLQAIPRTIVYDQKTGGNLIQWPVEEVESLRKSPKEFNQIKVEVGSIVPLRLPKCGDELDIMAEFEVDQEALERLPGLDEQYSCSASGGSSRRGALGPFGLLVLSSDDLIEQTPVYFYIVKDTNGTLTTFFCTDVSRSSLATDVLKETYGNTVPILKDEKFSVRVLVDHSIVEAYAQGGRTCITSRSYPTKAIYKDAKLFLFNNATHVNVTASVKTWQMSPASALYYSIGLHFLSMLLTFIAIGYV
ncbi:hypothetical protein V2J09_008033 [Rumex salicifolius]